MAARQPTGPPPPPVVQRVRVRYAKRGRLRFTSHRDLARALERALRRAGVPMAFSAGFSPHPRISYVGAAPTGVASEAEYLELALAERCHPAALRAALDEALPPGVDVVEVVEAVPGTGALPDRIEASDWTVELPGLAPGEVAAAVTAFLARDEVLVERLTKDGRRRLDARAAVVHARVTGPAPLPGAPSTDGDPPCAILRLVVRHATPAVRPDDVLSGLRLVADLVPPVPPRATRLAQGPLTADGEVGDPLAPDRDAAAAGPATPVTEPVTAPVGPVAGEPAAPAAQRQDAAGAAARPA